MSGDGRRRSGSRAGAAEVEVEVEWRPDVTLGVTIVDAVSEAIGVPVERIPFELNDYVDPDALDDLFADRVDGTPRRGGWLTLYVDGVEVTVGPDRRITVRSDS
jgi:hypothetical protein